MENFSKFVSKKPLDFKNKFKELKQNRKSLDRSAQFALAILDLLKKNGWSQVELAQKLDVSPQYVNKLVKGNENITFDTVDKLEAVFGVALINVVTHSNVIKQKEIQTQEVTTVDPFVIRPSTNSGMTVVHNNFKKKESTVAIVNPEISRIHSDEEDLLEM